eukprot:COSAG05_NODE_804_length_7211_cov_31.496766_4_plen_68_part_00
MRTVLIFQLEFDYCHIRIEKDCDSVLCVGCRFSETASGAVVSLQASASGKDWANATNPLGKYHFHSV